MGAWTGQAGAGYWLQEGIAGSGLQSYAEKQCKNLCGFDSGRVHAQEEEEEENRRRMVELMLGPCRNVQPPPPPTLDLLDAPPPLLSDSSPLPPLSSIDSTPIELEPDSPLPCGWEKCLDLKTGSIYYLNRSTGSNSLTDPKKALWYHGKSASVDLNSWSASPTTSEVTMEATVKSNGKQAALNMNERGEGDEGALDLNLSLHVGQSTSKPPLDHVSVSARPNCSLHPATTLKAPLSIPSASSSSSSITSYPINSTLPFSPGSIPGKELWPSPFQDIKNTINKQDSNHFSWLPTQESLFCGGAGNGDHLISTHSSLHRADTSQLWECQALGTSNAPMVMVACANCLMFVMLSRSNPKCPRCGTCPDQLEFPQPPFKRAKLGFSF